MTFNFGSDTLSLRGKTKNGIHIVITIDNEGYDDVPTEIILKYAKKLYTEFEAVEICLYRDDFYLCEIEKEDE